MNKLFLFSLLFAAPVFAAAPAVVRPAPLLLSFDGKDVAMAWDIGVMQSLNARLKKDRISEVYFTGASSGSILASFFACHGMDQNAMDIIVAASKVFPKDVLEVEETKKTLQLFLGVPPESTLDAVSPILDLVTDNSTCVPSFPFLIVASNLDVLDGRVPGKPFNGTRGRTFDRGTYVLSENGKARGKACTYFLNESMSRILHEVPAKERLCDLRIVRTGAELRTAIISSISEPTYYPAVPESDPSQIESIFPAPKARVYQGAFAMDSAIQDLKRARPESWVIGTGHPNYNRLENRMILNWFGLPMNLTLFEQRWWFDQQIPVTDTDWAWLHERKTTPTEQIAKGYAAAEACFASDRCLPKLTLKPAANKDLLGRPLDDKRARGVKAILN